MTSATTVLGPYRSKVLAEPLYRYTTGGFHPVHLGDLFKDKRYEILNKLGFGAFATIWLAKDHKLQRLVAIKVLVSDPGQKGVEVNIYRHLFSTTSDHPGQKHILRLLDSFEVNGPNGTHTCLVLEVTGRKVASESRASGKGAHNISKQTLLGLDYLHQNGVTHGDLHPGNLLLVSAEPDLRSEQEILEEIGEPHTSNVTRLDGEPLGPEVPRYIVEAQTFPMNLSSSNLCVKIADFGGSFYGSNRPDSMNCPMVFRPPEVLFGDDWDFRVDVWSMGVTIFEIVVGYPCFDSVMASKNSLAQDFIYTIGKLPQRWQEEWARLRKDEPETWVDDWESPDNVQEKLSDPGTELQLESLLKEAYFNENEEQDFSITDIEVLASLLRQMLRYDPSTRLLPSELLKHPWFAVDRPTKDEILLKQGEDTSGVEEVSEPEPQQEVEDMPKEPEQGTEDGEEEVVEIGKVPKVDESTPKGIDEGKPFEKTPEHPEEISHEEEPQASEIGPSRVDVSKADMVENDTTGFMTEGARRGSDEVQMQEASEDMPRGWTMTDWARWMRIGFWRLTLMISHGR